MRDQFKKDIISGDFDFGYVSGSQMISVRSEADLNELRSELQPGTKVTLQCDELKSAVTTGKRKQVSDNYSDEDKSSGSSKRPPAKKKSSQEDREEKILNVMEDLKKKHKSKYKPLQLRIWSEMFVGGIHHSLDDEPDCSMFTNCGKKRQCGTE